MNYRQLSKKYKIDDAKRGVMWENKHRGTLEEFERENPIPESEYTRWLVKAKTPKIDFPWELSNRIGLGTYRWKYDESIIEKAVELGFGLIDTAEGYGYGRVEICLGKIFAKLDLGQTQIATKVARNHLSYRAAINAAERSRERLKIPAIDLFQIHWPVTPFEPTLEAMAYLLAKGTIVNVGVSNFCAGQLSKAQRVAKTLGFQIKSNQIRINRADRANLSYLVPFCRKIGVRVIAYSPFCQGSGQFYGPSNLSWVLSWGGVYSTIPATNNLQHLKEIAQYAAK